MRGQNMTDLQIPDIGEKAHAMWEFCLTQNQWPRQKRRVFGEYRVHGIQFAQLNSRNSRHAVAIATLLSATV
jgi:hypothetical protein